MKFYLHKLYHPAWPNNATLSMQKNKISSTKQQSELAQMLIIGNKK